MEPGGGSRLDAVRFLVVGEAGVGKSALVHALCAGPAAPAPPGDRRTVGCRVSLRALADGLVEEFYDVCGGARFESGRPVFYRAAPYDGVLFVHDLSDPPTRAALARVWVPEVMAALGDVKAVDAAGRPEAAGQHVRSRGALNELRMLWMHFRSKHAGVTSIDALREGARLSWRLAMLLMNEYGVWTDDDIDMAAEKELLSCSSVPVAIVGLKRDLAPRGDWRNEIGEEHASVLVSTLVDAVELELRLTQGLRTLRFLSRFRTQRPSS